MIFFKLVLSLWHTSDNYYIKATICSFIVLQYFPRFSSYWDDITVKGFVPLLALVYFNSRIYLKIRASAKFENRHVGGGGGGGGGAGTSDRRSMNRKR